jgi:hypothetical protein
VDERNRETWMSGCFRAGVTLAAGMVLAVGAPPAAAQQVAAPAAPAEPAFEWDAADPRIGLAAGWDDAGTAAWNLELVSTLAKPEGFFNPEQPGDGGFNNTDLAFSGDYLFLGNYNGFQVYDISRPESPTLRLSVVCPGGQGDVSVQGDLLFMSVEQTRGRLDCGTEGVADSVSVERFRGVRIFDVSDIDNPRQVTTVQTCRGSHTHTLVTDPNDDENVYIYVSGTGGVRSPSELEGCSPLGPDEDPNTSLFRIEVIQVPVAAPAQARVVSMPRIFADTETGDIAGLWRGGDHGEGTQRSRVTNQCHDITVYPEIGLAAGACSGNGILLDISDPANPVRMHEVADPNFAYWHSATFNNDGTRILFTDEWGGGSAPRCRATDPPTWGANAIFHLVDGKMVHAGYYKLPVPQTETENCVAHNGSLVPVPGRDIMAQAWYQGGLSVFDFTDPTDPVEIAFFDRGPLSDTQLFTGGYWSTYYHNGYVYGAEISRGIDVFKLTASEHLSANEVAAAEAVEMREFNAQNQPRVTWPATPVVAHSYLDQLERTGGLSAGMIVTGRRAVDGGARDELEGFAGWLEGHAGAVASSASVDARRMRALAGTLRAMAEN